VQLLERLRLFSAVFAPPPPLAPLLGDAYGAPCAAVMAAAEALHKASGIEVWSCARFSVVCFVFLP
jgi:hypothetical protein